SALIQGSLKKSELGRLISEKSDAKEKTTLFKLLKNYRSTLDSVSDAVRMLNSERPDKRRGAYTYLSNYPLSPGAVLALVERLFDATLFERMEIAGILKDKAENYTEKRLLNFLFFVNRERKIYSVYRGFFFERSENYESLNMLLNKLFSDAREDMLLQYLIIEEAYNRGYNSFIRSVANEHIKQFFSVISEFQSGCQEECSIRILYELKGCQVILLKEREIAKTVFGESSDLFSILSEKEAEITKLLEKYKFALQKPVISDPSEGQPLDRLNLVNEKQILKFLYQAEPDISKRKTIVKILGE
ncbi:MAG: hypothetical protein N3B13_00895, partial [Deltaproteobacteria bacterium]|nr:hypothetical protein [Deltaproteobacteria bacterium]